MRNLISAGTASLFLVLGAVNANAAPRNSAPAPDGAIKAATSPVPLIEGRSAYEIPAGAYGGLDVNDFGDPRINYGAPASAKDFGGTEYIR
jgi:hypothetical protein